MTSQLKADPEREPEMTTVHHRYATVDGRRLFYREAGPAGAPAVVLLHPGTISVQIGPRW